MNKLAPKEWFEMHEIRKRFYDKSTWTPLKEGCALIREGVNGHLEFREEYLGIQSLLVPLDGRKQAEKIMWRDIGRTSTGYVEAGEYVPAYIYKSWGEEFRAEYPVIESRGSSIDLCEWYLNPDMIVTLNLKKEGDSWLAIEYGYEEVVKIEKDSLGSPVALLIKTTFLKDYLKARKMGLYMTSYRSRTQIVEDASAIDWQDPNELNENMDRWEGRITEIHEGGHPFGSKFSVMNVSRTDVDYDADIPEFDFATDEVTKMDTWEGGYKGKKLFRVMGELWRREWVEPSDVSQIVLNEEVEPVVYFITDNSGKTENRRTLIEGSRWLWFHPTVVNSILSIRGSSLSWFTKDTGSVGCAPSDGVHFGVNQLGLINVYAKDIGLLPDWQQKVWAAHNIPPEGKVSAELLMSQMEAKPASTQAPEDFIQRGTNTLNELSSEKYGFLIIKNHPEVDNIVRRVHRFRATTKEGLFELAKDLYRLIGERIDADSIKTVINPGKGEAWGSLKSLENLLSLDVNQAFAYKITGILWGIYTLRHADSHLPSSKEIEKAYELIGIDTSQPFVIQGKKMLNEFVTCIYTMCEIMKPSK